MRNRLFSVIILIIFFFAPSVFAEEIIYKIKGEEKYRLAEVKPEAIANFLRNPNIEKAERNIRRYALSAPNDIFYNYQWHLPEIKAAKAWSMEEGKKGVVVAVLDTGIAIGHPDLEEKIWQNSDEIADNNIDDDNNGYIDDTHGWDFINDNNNPKPDLTGDKTEIGLIHGTHVSGIIGASSDNSIGVAGVCQKCTVMPLQVLDDEGSGTIKAIHDAIYYAADNGADVINLSFGSYGDSDAENEAVQYAQDMGIVVVAAAGNDEKNLNKKPIYPACHEGVLGVGATNKNQKAAYFSNYGSDCVDVSAPGTYIFSTYYKNKSLGYDDYYGYMEGTSMATPIVSGLAGLLKSYNEKLTRKNIMHYIKANADDAGLGDKMGTGIINAYQSLQEAKEEK
ncbi:MAG: S8 family peptidase [Patescibacteria group bacterium]